MKPVDIVIMNTNIAIKWDDGSESFINNRQLRDACPCANCSGESDIFGNVYKNNQIKSNVGDSQYQIINYRNVGHYAIRIQWGDGHNSGIYAFNFLNTFDAK